MTTQNPLVGLYLASLLNLNKLRVARIVDLAKADIATHKRILNGTSYQKLSLSKEVRKELFSHIDFDSQSRRFRSEEAIASGIKQLFAGYAEVSHVIVRFSSNLISGQTQITLEIHFPGLRRN